MNLLKNNRGDARWTFTSAAILPVALDCGTIILSISRHYNRDVKSKCDNSKKIWCNNATESMEPLKIKIN